MKKSFNHATFAGLRDFCFSVKIAEGKQIHEKPRKSVYRPEKDGIKMANVQEKVKDGKVVSFKFTAFMGRDESGKQRFKTMTWFPPVDLTPAKIKRAAEIEAEIWERKAKEEYLQEQEERNKPKEYTLDGFIKDVWWTSMQVGTRKARSL